MRVTVITPLSRNRDIQNTIDNYLRQDWPDKELCIFNDDGRTDYMDVEQKIWVWGEQGRTIGYKRNELCRLAKGEIIVHFDSDDHYEPDYITICVAALSNTDITGLSAAYFHKGNEIYLYQYTGGQPYVIGSGMAYWRKCWERHPFEDIQVKEDAKFQANNGIIRSHGAIDSFYAVIHDSNTCSHKTLPYMKRIK